MFTAIGIIIVLAVLILALRLVDSFYNGTQFWPWDDKQKEDWQPIPILDEPVGKKPYRTKFDIIEELTGVRLEQE